MYTGHNIRRAIAIFVTTTLLLNVMAPALAPAATYLQGTEVNTNTLIRDEYVQVTYRDHNGQEKTEKGWIDAIGETSFTIREGGFLSKKTIAYDDVLSVVMSDESTVPAKQMNEVNRFSREMKEREIEQAKREAEQEAIQHLKQRLKDKFVTIGQFDFSKKKGYAHIVYTSDGTKKAATGQIRERYSNHIVVSAQESGGLKIRRIILYTDIDILIVAQSQRDMEAWGDVRQTQRHREQATQQLSEGEPRVRVYAPSIRKGWMIGNLVKMTQDTLVVRGELTLYGRRFYQVPRSSISNLEVSIEQRKNTFKGMAIGIGIGFSISTALTSLYAGRFSINLPWVLSGKYGRIIFIGPICICTLIGAITKSDKWIEVPPDRFNLSVAPTSSKGLRAALTFNF